MEYILSCHLTPQLFQQGLNPRRTGGYHGAGIPSPGQTLFRTSSDPSLVGSIHTPHP